MQVLHELFDVLRVKVAAVDDQQVLAAAGDVELALVEQPEVAGAQVGAGAVGGVGVKPLDGLGGPVVVAACDARAAQPDLADPTVGQLAQGFRVDDVDADTTSPLTRTHQAD